MQATSARQRPSTLLAQRYWFALLVLLVPMLIPGTIRQFGSSHHGFRGRADTKQLGQSEIRAWERVEDLPKDLAIFETVFWEPADTTSLRQYIRSTDCVRGKRVLEIGTGSGLLALCCLQAGAEQVVATDVNPAALANARFNAERLGLSARLELRLVSPNQPEAFTVIDDDERFDLVVSNPPWENQVPNKVEDAALYDPGFVLLDSLLRDTPGHLRPGGRLLLAYGSVEAIRRIQRRAAEYGANVHIHDMRDLRTLPTVFLPGMLIEVEF